MIIVANQIWQENKKLNENVQGMSMQVEAYKKRATVQDQLDELQEVCFFSL